jgi:hypothetical protein
MNQVFSFNRFSLLVLKHWADNKKRYVLSVIAFIGLLIAWFVFSILTDMSAPMSKEIQHITFFFSLFVVGTFYASQYFRDLGSRPKGINFLLVPASAFEKILCSLLYTVVFFFIVFVATFYLADTLMVSIADSFIATKDVPGERGVLNVFAASSLPFERNQTINILLIFFTIQAAFLLGSVYFENIVSSKPSSVVLLSSLLFFAWSILYMST